MARPRAGLLLVLVACVAVAVGPCQGKKTDEPSKEGDVILLTDANFDRETATGVWMIDIFAPWCSHCQQLEPAWRMLATELKPHDVKVAKIDGMKNKVLMKRFSVLGFPSIYLLREGQTWQYTGMRSVAEMKDFALKDYKRATKLPSHKAPNSLVGRILGIGYSLPTYAQRAYGFLKEEKGFSDTAIISGVLLVPLALGAIFICVLDVLYTRQQGYDTHEHYE